MRSQKKRIIRSSGSIRQGSCDKKAGMNRSAERPDDPGDRLLDEQADGSQCKTFFQSH
jgi:hypothetical protein